MDIKAAVKKTRRVYRKYRKLFKLIAFTAILVCAVLYFISFFSGGVTFRGVFLHKETDKNMVIYSGMDSYGGISITVSKAGQDEYQIAYQVPFNNKPKVYSIAMEEIPEKKPDVQPRFNTVISSSGGIVFEGTYQKGNPFLSDSGGIPKYNAVEEKRNGENPYINFEPNLRNMMGIATGEYAQIRGNLPKMLFGLALIGLVLFDMTKPVLSMKIRETLSGGEVLPKDFSGLIQLAVRAVILAVGIGFLFAAL